MPEMYMITGIKRDVGSWMFASCLKLITDKTELLWAGSRFSNVPLGNLGPSLQLGFTSNYVRVLGITFSCDLSLEKHVSNVCSTCFY